MSRKIIDEYPVARDATDDLPSGGGIREDSFPPEDQTVCETADDRPAAVVPDEYTQRPEAVFDEAKAEAERAAKRKKLLDRLIKPLAATALTVTAVTSALGLDILGYDAFAGESFDYMLREHLMGWKDSWQDSSHDSREYWVEYPGSTEYDKDFPELDNTDPDFDGASAWDEFGSEIYVRLTRSGEDEPLYLVAGDWWVSQEGATVTDVEGASYNRKTNTLTLDGFSGGKLETNAMGNGFTVRLIGDNYLGSIEIWGAGYGGSVTFTGSGTLTVESWNGEAALRLIAEGSSSCVMFDNGPTVVLRGSPAIIVEGTTLEKSILFKRRMRVFGGDYHSEQLEEKDGGLYTGYYAIPETSEEGETGEFLPSDMIVAIPKSKQNQVITEN